MDLAPNGQRKSEQHFGYQVMASGLDPLRHRRQRKRRRTAAQRAVILDPAFGVDATVGVIAVDERTTVIDPHQPGLVTRAAGGAPARPLSLQAQQPGSALRPRLFWRQPRPKLAWLVQVHLAVHSAPRGRHPEWIGLDRDGESGLPDWKSGIGLGEGGYGGPHRPRLFRPPKA